MSDQPTTLADLVEGARFAMFTTQDADGTLVSRPMTIQEVTDDALVFISQAKTDVSLQSDGKQVNLAIAEDGRWVSIAGVGEVSDDHATKERLWNSANDAYTDGGPENPENVVIRVRADSAEYWDTPGGLGIVKARLTGDKPQLGEHGTVDL
ncbi:MAG TPA: pyridoxamine 5'-phosphate oxidase family protein [Micropruina sp.]|nr:pyridoxamine 5'-phosphate oxidase family protein [Micropruina sp.]HMR22901.1 pyridoxamine 5'-phosphate oxidase family protein [Micropruina sp.]